MSLIVAVAGTSTAGENIVVFSRHENNLAFENGMNTSCVHNIVAEPGASLRRPRINAVPGTTHEERTSIDAVPDASSNDVLIFLAHFTTMVMTKTMKSTQMIMNRKLFISD